MKNKKNIQALISEVEQRMEHPYEYLIYDPAWRVTPRKERYSAFKKFYCGEQYTLNCTSDSEGHTYFTIVEECPFDDHRLWFVVETYVKGGEPFNSRCILPENLLQPSDETEDFWNEKVPEVVEHVLLDTLEHFMRMDIANSELTIASTWTLAELERRFTETFEAELCIYDGDKRICNDPRQIKELGVSVNDTLLVRGIDQIKDIIRSMQETLGLNVRICDQRYGQPAPDTIPLYIVRDTPRPHHDMEPLSK
jgi:hypothetical protein